MRISDWSSDVCSSDLGVGAALSGRIPVRSPSGGDTAIPLAADPARPDPADPAEEIGPCLSAGVDEGWVAARRLYPRYGAGVAGQAGAGGDGRLGHALGQSFYRLACGGRQSTGLK